MAKDYAKNKNGRKKKGASRSKNKSPAPKGLITTAILLVSGLIVLLVYLKWYQPKPTTIPQKKTAPVKTVEKKTGKPSKNATNIIADDEVPFYQIHEEMINKTVEIPADDLKLPEDAHRYVYLMPCGSFRESSRAEELKAKIALTGYESKIKSVNVKSGLWHRVELGPFKSRRKAESIRHRLQDNGFNYCMILPIKIK